ncbi:MAG: beta-mannosidase [Promethearchaeota archaeon]
MDKVEKISLTENWRLLHKERDLNIPTKVPGSVFETLIDKEIIANPFYGLNEHEVSWVYESEWDYETEFDLEPDFLEHENILLRCHGLDTISEVILNGENLGSTNNMFVRYDFRVKSKLKSKGNRLSIKFKSPTIKAREEKDKRDINLNTGYAAIPGVPYLRKAQYSFGWDWGPKLPDIGIWKSVELIGYDSLKIDSIYISQKLNYNKNLNELSELKDITDLGVMSLDLSIEINLESDLSTSELNNYKLKVDLKAPDGKIFTSEKSINILAPKVEFTIEYPYLWWTHDLGIPHLYDLSVTISKNGMIDSFKQKVGMREIRLIQNVDEWGESFFFKLNGVPIFAKGANWIPVDSFIPRGKKRGLYQSNLVNAKEANMNMIRVWGGGIYEDDLFYDSCDELGILVWQDFPFACAVYPHDEEFIENFKVEAIQNIQRLRNHPSLALWCGNNEIEWLWKWELQNAEIIQDDKIAEFKSGYLTVIEKILPELINRYDPNHPYWPSSPSNGFVGDNLGTQISNSPDIGDSHFWDVWHRNKPFRAYRKFNSRFMSEFGYESFPSIKTIEKICPTDQFDFFSPMMENHQKNSAGNKKILDYMKKRFEIPPEFENQVILSQITQAEAIQYGVEHWRRNRNDFHCMGALFWQLNDCWPVASWSSLDYYGRWKALHYFAKRFYQNVFASIKEDKNSVEFWVTNDLKKRKSVLFEWKMFNSESNKICVDMHEVDIPPLSSKMVGTLDVNKINEVKENLYDHIIFYQLKTDDKKKLIIDQGIKLFDAPKKFNLQDPSIKWEIFKIEKEDLTDINVGIKVSNEFIALFVFLDSNEYDFVASDNFFSMGPNEARTIKLSKLKKRDGSSLSIQEIKKEEFNVRSLFDLIILRGNT